MKKLNNKKVKILGIKYKIIMKNGADEDKSLETRGGYIDFYTKEIILDSFEWAKNNPNSVSDVNGLIAECCRHEVIHAFFYESGLAHSSNDVTKWAMNEELVDWIALQFHKIAKVFKKLSI